jgi:5-methylcytosine-specific restriction endonuclease McrA
MTSSIPRRKPLRSKRGPGSTRIPAAVRRAVVERFDGHCALCLREGAHQHHVRSRGAGGKDTIDNLALLCAEHHSAVHDDPRVKRRLLAVLAALAAMEAP